MLCFHVGSPVLCAPVLSLVCGESALDPVSGSRLCPAAAQWSRRAPAERPPQADPGRNNGASDSQSPGELRQGGRPGGARGRQKSS